MKNTLVILSLLILGTMAYYDLQDRLIDIDKIGANTPAQVELNQTITSPTTSTINQDINTLTPLKDKQPSTLRQEINQNSSDIKDSFQSVQERRNTITTPVQ